jgi:hypothetical protein
LNLLVVNARFQAITLLWIWLRLLQCTHDLIQVGPDGHNSTIGKANEYACIKRFGIGQRFFVDLVCQLAVAFQDRK